MNPLVTKLFTIEREIMAAIPDKYEVVDAGMMIPPNLAEANLLWRDMTIENTSNPEGKEWSFSYSTTGELMGDVPPDCLLDIQRVLLINKTPQPKKVISNVE